MKDDVRIVELNNVANSNHELADLLIKTVDNGASIGFLLPLTMEDAIRYCSSTVADNIKLYVAKINEKIVGSVQLHLCTKENSLHRAEVAKLMVHPNYRRLGIGRKLMKHLEADAKQLNKSLLVLDTREGDVSNTLYVSLNYTEVGRIPSFAKSIDGKLAATVIYYKTL